MDLRRRLELSDQGLLQWGGQGESVGIALDSPFVVQTSVWLISDDELDLHVCLRQADAPATQPSLKFVVRLDHSEVARSVPVKQERAACISAEDFESIWKAIVSHARLHGDPPRGVRFSRPDSSELKTLPAEVEQPQETSVEQTRTVEV